MLNPIRTALSEQSVCLDCWECCELHGLDKEFQILKYFSPIFKISHTRPCEIQTMLHVKSKEKSSTFLRDFREISKGDGLCQLKMQAVD